MSAGNSEIRLPDAYVSLMEQDQEDLPEWPLVMSALEELSQEHARVAAVLMLAYKEDKGVRQKTKLPFKARKAKGGKVQFKSDEIPSELQILLAKYVRHLSG